MGKRKKQEVLPCPESFQLLGKAWQVKFGNMADDGMYGQCHHSELKIDVSTAQPLDGQKDTLLHEVTHAIDLELGLKLREKQVRRLATATLSWMRDNPEIVFWLLSRE